MKKLAIISLCAVASFSVLGMSSCSNKTQIGILQIVSQTALNKAQKGFINQLKADGFDDSKVNFNVQIPEGDSATETSMAANLASSSDLVFGIATSSSLALKSAVADLEKKTPVLFSAVTDPVASGLVKSFTDHGNVVGTSDNVPTKKNIELFKEFSITKIGIIYNTSESNSQIQKTEAQAACDELGIELVSGGFSEAANLDSTLKGLIASGIKGLFIPTDNTVAAAMTNIKDELITNKIVSVCADGNETANGGALGFGVDYYSLGQQTGKMASAILNGTDISTLSCSVSDSFPLSINNDFFTSTGIAIPDSVKAMVGSN